MNLNEFQQLEKVKISYLKHRGNILEISKELSLPVDYVKKNVDKLKKCESRDVSLLIANTLMTYIMGGVQSRVVRLTEMLGTLESKEQLLVSSCCDFPVCESVVDGLQLFTCLKCNKNCNAVLASKLDVYRIKKDILEQLREEDVALIAMAERLGYTNKPPEQGPTTVIQQKQNILVVNSEKGKQITEDISNLSPQTQHQLAEKLRKEILELDDEITRETTEETGNQDSLR